MSYVKFVYMLFGSTGIIYMFGKNYGESEQSYFDAPHTRPVYQGQFFFFARTDILL